MFNQILSTDPAAKQVWASLTMDADYLPPRIHIGDIDSDGYPDILVTIQYANGSSIPQILLNQEMPPTTTPKTGLSDLQFDKISIDTQDQKYSVSKNRYFNLN